MFANVRRLIQQCLGNALFWASPGSMIEQLWMDIGIILWSYIIITFHEQSQPSFWAEKNNRIIKTWSKRIPFGGGVIAIDPTCIHIGRLERKGGFKGERGERPPQRGSKVDKTQDKALAFE